MFINIYYNVERIEAWSRSWVASQHMHEPRPRDMYARDRRFALSRVCEISLCLSCVVS